MGLGFTAVGIITERIDWLCRTRHSQATMRNPRFQKVVHSDTLKTSLLELNLLCTLTLVILPQGWVLNMERSVNKRDPDAHQCETD